MQHASDPSLDILPNTVRSLPNIVRFSLPRKRSTGGATKTPTQSAISTMSFGITLKNTLIIFIGKVV